MLKRFKRLRVILIFSLCLNTSTARADFFGGDLAFLAQLVANAIQQLYQLKQIFGMGKDTLEFLQEVNEGISDAMGIMKTLNSTLQPGVLSDLSDVNQLLSAIEQLYGKIPITSESKLQSFNDQSVAESIHLHNEAFRYAQKVDPEAERIKDYAKNVSPQGAGKLTAESIGVLIHVMNQVLRTNAALLKVQSEQLALMNRKEKINSEQFKTQYEGMAKAFGSLKPQYKLNGLNGN